MQIHGRIRSLQDTHRRNPRVPRQSAGKTVSRAGSEDLDALTTHVSITRLSGLADCSGQQPNYHRPQTISGMERENLRDVFHY